MATYTGSDKAISYLFTASNNTAEEYDSAATYAAGDFAMYEGVLYICTTAIVTPESFNPAKWTQKKIMDNTGGGGGGTTVVANPAGAATETLNKLQVSQTIYSIPGGGTAQHTYTTAEQVVGTWINGKTIYEKVFTLTAPTTGNTGVDVENVAALSIDDIIRFDGAIKVQNNITTHGGNSFLLWYRRASTTIACNVTNASYLGGDMYIILQYTKT